MRRGGREIACIFTYTLDLEFYARLARPLLSFFYIISKTDCLSIMSEKRGWLCTLLVLPREAVLVLQPHNIEQPRIAMEKGEDSKDHDEQRGKSVELCPQNGHHGHVAHEAVEGRGPGSRTAEEEGEVVG